MTTISISILHIKLLNGTVNRLLKLRFIVSLLVLQNLIETKRCCFQRRPKENCLEYKSLFGEGSDVFVVAAKDSIWKMPKMNFGNQPRDGGYFVIKEDEYNQIVSEEPELKKWLYPYMVLMNLLKAKNAGAYGLNTLRRRTL